MLTASQPPHWTTISQRKRNEAYDRIPSEWRLPTSYTDRVGEHAVWNVLSVPRECGILSHMDIEITEKFDAVALVQAIATAKFTAEQVAIAFCKRAAIAQQLTQCLTETFFDQAIARARELDAYFQETGKVKGPLHGLPVSLKDPFNVKGVASTIAYVSFIDDPVASTNSPIVETLLQLGAVLYVKTNIPQLQMSPESENNIFGRVLNPRNLSWGAGGSSGGEGALVALRGSLIGVGTDIAGSIRIPSLSCGIFGFKPTASRVPYGGQRSGNRRGNPGIQPSAGPLATSFRDLKFFMETVIGARPWNYDPTALAVPWRDIGRTLSPLTLGYVGEDPQYPLHPPVVRALRSAMDKLTGVGHKVKVLENVPSISKAALLAFKLFELDNNNTALRPLEDSGEPEIPSLKTSNMTFPGHQFTLEELFDLNAERAQFVADWEKVWLENDLDAIIMPGHRKTAGPHETYGHPPYTLVWNLVDRPACVIPYESTNASIDSIDTPLSDYDPHIVDGAPCTVQVVGRKLQDEELLRVGEIVSAALHS